MCGARYTAAVVVLLLSAAVAADSEFFHFTQSAVSPPALIDATFYGGIAILSNASSLASVTRPGWNDILYTAGFATAGVRGYPSYVANDVEDVVLEAYSATNGSWLWTTQFAITRCRDQPLGVAVDQSTGNVFVAARRLSTVGNGNFGQMEVIAFDGITGAYRFYLSPVSAHIAAPGGVAVHAATQRVVLVGSCFADFIVFGTRSENSQFGTNYGGNGFQSPDWCVMMATTDGTALWSQMVGFASQSYDECRAVAFADDASDDFGAVYGAGKFGNDRGVAKWNITGSRQWMRITSGGQFQALCADAMPGGGGGVIAVGTSSSYTPALAARYNSTGDLIWSVAYGGGSFCDAGGVSMDGNFDLWITGSCEFGPIPAIVAAGNTGSGVYLIKVSRVDGSVIWGRGISDRSQSASFANSYTRRAAYHAKSNSLFATFVPGAPLPEPCTAGECPTRGQIAACPVNAYCTRGSIAGCQPGYSGDMCQTDINECASAPCANGGACTDLVNAFTCTCATAAYSGAMCQTEVNECASQPCANAGTCMDGIGSYSCICAAGSFGSRCQTDINECASQPCTVAGTAACVDGTNSFTCACRAGYSGVLCQTDINECASNPCVNGGTCVDGVSSYSCRCVSGYSGVRCQTNVNECASNPCGNGGTCADGVNGYTCTCTAPWTGSACQLSSNDCIRLGVVCANGGTCVDDTTRDGQYYCQCDSGYSGSLCERPPSQFVGARNTSVYFDGLHTGYQFYNLSFNALLRAQFWSFEFWCAFPPNRLQPVGTEYRALFSHNRGTGMGGIAIGWSSGRLFYAVVGTAWNEVALSTGLMAMDGTWHHYAVTVSPTAHCLYVDGAVDNCNTATGSPNGITAPSSISNSLPTVLGSEDTVFSANRGWIGSVDGVKLWAKPLTASQVLNSYATPRVVNGSATAAEPDLLSSIGWSSTGHHLVELKPAAAVGGVLNWTLHSHSSLSRVAVPAQTYVIGAASCTQPSCGYMCVTGDSGGFANERCLASCTLPDRTCLNGGVCDLQSGSRCGCAVGFTGVRCEVNINDCAPSPCANGGTCVDGLNSYTCVCGGGYSGLRCVIPPTGLTGPAVRDGYARLILHFGQPLSSVPDLSAFFGAVIARLAVAGAVPESRFQVVWHQPEDKDLVAASASRTSAVVFAADSGFQVWVDVQTSTDPASSIPSIVTAINQNLGAQPLAGVTANPSGAVTYANPPPPDPGSDDTGSGSGSGGSGLSGGAIAGIVIALIGVLAVAAGVFWYRTRRVPPPKSVATDFDAPQKPVQPTSTPAAAAAAAGSAASIEMHTVTVSPTAPQVQQ